MHIYFVRFMFVASEIMTKTEMSINNVKQATYYTICIVINVAYAGWQRVEFKNLLSK